MARSRRGREFVPTPGPLERTLVELVPLSEVTPKQLYQLGQFLEYDKSYRLPGWELVAVEVMVRLVLPATVENSYGDSDGRREAAKVLSQFLSCMSDEDSEESGWAVEQFLTEGIAWLTGGTDKEVQRKFGARGFTSLMEALSLTGKVPVPLMGSVWRTLTAYSPREHAWLVPDYHLEASGQLIRNYDLPAVIAARLLLPYETTGSFNRFQQKQQHLRNIRSSFPDLADLPDGMLLRVVASQEPETEWLQDALPYRRDPSWFAPPVPDLEF